MTRALLLALVALCAEGCLVPDGPGISVRDTNPPRLLRTVPAENGEILPDSDVQVIFSEPMDPRSLEAGLVLLSGTEQQAITLFLPPPGGIPEAVQPEAPYAVRLRLASGPWPSAAGYTVVLTPLLTDTAGNPLQEEVRVNLFSAP